MKICLISPLFEPWIVGGAENYIIHLAHELSETNEVMVITTQGPVPRKKVKNAKFKIVEIKTKNVKTLYEIVTDPSISIVKKLLWNFLDLWNISIYLLIKRILRNFNPDIIHTNGIKGLSPSIFSAIKDLNIPHTHTLHDYELISRWGTLFRHHRVIEKFNPLDRFYLKFMKKISGNIDSVIGPSKFIMDYHEKLGFFNNSTLHIVPHGIILNEQVIPKENFTKEFIFVGNIAENKGPHIAIQAIKKSEKKNLKLHIVGTGQFLKETQKIANGDDRIIFHGYVEKSVLDELFRKCSCVIVPSIWYETFGLIILESLNNGLPVLGSDIGGIPELVINDYNGFLFEPGNVNALTTLIEEISNNEELFFKLNKNAIISSKKFPMSDQLSKTLEIYQDTINSKKSPN